MGDTTESSRQATHAKQEGVDDNVAALAGASVDVSQGADQGADHGTPSDLASTLSTMDDAAPAESRWSSSADAAPAASATTSSATKKPGGELSATWIAAGMGIGSAALVAALLYANRNNERKRDKR